MSASRTASAAELAQRTPMAAPACISFSPSRCGNSTSQADIRPTTPASLQAGGNCLARFAEANEAE